MKKALLLIFAIAAIIYFFLSSNTTVLNEVTEEELLPKSSASVSELNLGSDKNTEKPATTVGNIQIQANTDETKTNVASRPEDYIVTCPAIEEKEETDLQIEQAQKALARHWLSSTNPHERVNADIFTLHPTEQKYINGLLDYHNQFPNSEIAYDRLLDLCSAKKSEYCTDDFFEKAAEIDNNNGLLLLKIASYYLKQGNETLAFEYIRNASQREVFDSYHFHYVESAWRSIKNIRQQPDALIDAIGYAAALSWNAMEFSKFCMKQEQPREIDACVSLGQAMQTGARTGFIQVLGGAIEKHYAEIDGKYETVNNIDMKYRAAIQAISAESVLTSYTLATYDDSLAEDMLNNAKNYGEVESAHLLVKEAIWRSKDPNYNPCQ